MHVGEEGRFPGIVSRPVVLPTSLLRTSSAQLAVARTMLVASAALFAASWQPAPLVRVLNQRTPVLEIVHNPLEVVRTQRTPAIEMLLPKAVAAVFFVPWVFVVVTNNLPEEQRLKIQKSPMLQGGTKMKSMKTVRRQPSKVG